MVLTGIRSITMLKQKRAIVSLDDLIELEFNQFYIIPRNFEGREVIIILFI